MAHADYDCCAVCDTKMNYNGGEAETKERICGECVAQMARAGVIAGTVSELLDALRNATTRQAALNAMRAAGYRRCFYYNNPVDKLVGTELEGGR